MISVGPPNSRGLAREARSRLRLAVGGAVVQVGASADSLNSTFTGSETEFTDVGNTQFLHRALMTNLSPGTRHYYRVGSGAASEWSAVFAFSTQTVRAGAPTDGRQSVLAVFGDLGIDVNAQKTLPKIIAEAQAGHFDAILHIGGGCEHGSRGRTLVYTHSCARDDARARDQRHTPAMHTTSPGPRRFCVRLPVCERSDGRRVHGRH